MNYEKIDFFKFVDNFKKDEKIESIEVFNNMNNVNNHVTISIPTYKRHTLLKQTIDSALNQLAFVDYNIIVIDNNPERNDDTEIMMMDNYKNNSMVSYYKNTQNLGMAGNWNRLFILCKSKYLVMLHDDDLLLNNFLFQTMRIIPNLKDFCILKPETTIWHSQNNVAPKHKKDSKNNIYTLNAKSLIATNYLGAPSGIVFERQKVLKLGGFNSDYFPAIDYIFFVNAALKYNLYYFSKELSIYRYEINESLKLDTKLNYIKIEYFLKNQLASILNFSTLSLKLIHYLNIGIRLRDLNSSYTGYKKMTIDSKNFKFANNFDVLISKMVYRIFFLYYAKRHSKNK